MKTSISPPTKIAAVMNRESPRGIWSDGTTMWVADNGVDRQDIRLRSMTTKARVSTKDFTILTAAGNDGSWWRYSHLVRWHHHVGIEWMIAGEDDKVYAYDALGVWST